MTLTRLELPIEEIASIMINPDFDVGASLRMQRQLLAGKAVQLRGLIAAVDAAARRWGETEAWRQSKGVITKMLAKRPDDRYQNAAEVRTALIAALPRR